MGSSIVRQVTEAIADAEGTEPTDLGFAIQEYVETDAIRQLSNHDRGLWTLEFEVPDHTVTVTCGETIRVDGTRKQDLA